MAVLQYLLEEPGKCTNNLKAEDGFREFLNANRTYLEEKKFWCEMSFSGVADKMPVEDY
jgi:hypothetical protein